MAWTEKIGKNSWRVRYMKKDGRIGSVAGFRGAREARNYADDLEADKRRGRRYDPDDAKTTVTKWAAVWIDTIDVDIRTETNYRSILRNHILPRWGTESLGDILASDTNKWLKGLRDNGYAYPTVGTIRSVFSMLLDDAVDERLIDSSPVQHKRRRGRRCPKHAMPRERIWGTPSQVLRIANQAALLGGPNARLLIITAGWTGARWGELTGLHRSNVRLTNRGGSITIDPDTGSLHEGNNTLWLGPPKTPASVRTISLPPFLATLLREHLCSTINDFVFTTPNGHWIHRSNFDRRILRPAVDGNLTKHNAAVQTRPIQPGLTFHGLRHSHKTWLIADNIPEIAQARRLGHHLDNRIIETYSHVAPEVEQRLLRALERRWRNTHPTTHLHAA
ncbi:site-specific integrase [Allokutzneria sp. A3M-2-11 16]|uniref:tyrosine-type recombinase/integrase n=1 Tax=Allokutzneria sp. A3M-2-11 16 TaxID=2962043 RepID=UPI0020B70EB4|nr:site-specific integrase [Allokutzneria sp. A3M-2-11 16]MCP3798454.1 site-specific integrase [Allokutzneria sp. A3M-2-11 16]